MTLYLPHLYESALKNAFGSEIYQVPPEVAMVSIRFLAALDLSEPTLSIHEGTKMRISLGDIDLAVFSELVPGHSVRAVITGGPFNSPNEEILTRDPIRPTDGPLSVRHAIKEFEHFKVIK